jgi:hypothetical protein
MKENLPLLEPTHAGAQETLRLRCALLCVRACVRTTLFTGFGVNSILQSDEKRPFTSEKIHVKLALMTIQRCLEAKFFHSLGKIL